ncbi:hypothetical protein PO909_012646 [Leuciscus waleckii]
MTLEEPGGEQASPRAPGPLRCGPCAVWPRQQTWLCVVPLLMGFVGLGLSLMLLKWIVVGSVQDYVPTDLVDANRIGQDPIFLSKPSALPKGSDGSTSTTSSTPSVAPGSATRAAEGTGAKEVTPRSTTVRKPNGEGGSRNASPSSRAGPPSTTTSSTTTTTMTPSTTSTQAAQPTSTLASPSKPGQRWNHGRSSKGPSTKPTRPHHRFRTRKCNLLNISIVCMHGCGCVNMLVCVSLPHCL